MSGVDGVALGVLVVFFLLVTGVGFAAARWRRAGSMASLDEWGLGGRGFGTLVTWFLLGGDLYTAYTFVAVPAAMFATGAVGGWFAVPFAVLTFPLVFVFMPRLWSVAHRHGYVTPADFVRGRYDSSLLSLAVAVTGILATMPYIALQLVGIQAVLEVIGLGGRGNRLARDLPLLVAFAVLAAYTYSSGLRAPALIAFVKDTLIYLVIVVATVWMAWKVGFGHAFDAARSRLTARNPASSGAPKAFVPGPAQTLAYGTLALGSAMALFMYPHLVTAVLSSRSRRVIRRNAAILPAYSLLLGLLALLGFAAIAVGTRPIGLDGRPNPQLVVPQLFEDNFASWFAGVAFAAIATSALVPAAIMSIAAANLFTRNIWREYVDHSADPAREASVSKLVSLIVKACALAFVLTLERQNAINFQLLGGVWILQTFPAIVFGLYTRWFHRWALLAGWAAAMVYGTLAAYRQASPTTRHFGSSLADVPGFDRLGYIALTAFVLNVAVAAVLTVVLRAVKAPEGQDRTGPSDYHADEHDPREKPLPDPAGLPPTADGRTAGRCSAGRVRPRSCGTHGGTPPGVRPSRVLYEYGYVRTSARRDPDRPAGRVRGRGGPDRPRLPG